jgi:dTDP-4-amino-4,6-dideoxygalactose transaminase
VTVKKAAPVPIADPHRVAVEFQAELSRSFERFLANGRFIMGPEHAAFERDFADFVGVAQCVGLTRSNLRSSAWVAAPGRRS